MKRPFCIKLEVEKLYKTVHHEGIYSLQISFLYISMFLCTQLIPTCFCLICFSCVAATHFRTLNIVLLVYRRAFLGFVWLCIFDLSLNFNIINHIKSSLVMLTNITKYLTEVLSRHRGFLKIWFQEMKQKFNKFLCRDQEEISLHANQHYGNSLKPSSISTSLKLTGSTGFPAFLLPCQLWKTRIKNVAWLW